MGSTATRILRPARTEDFEELLRVNLAAFRAGHGTALSPEAGPLSAEAARAQWRRFLEHWPQGRTVTVAEVAGRLCGFVGAGPARDEDLDSSTGELYSLYVDPELWNQGHGSALHDAALEELLRAGFTGATLWMVEENARTARFYRTRGWEPDGARRPFRGAISVRLRRALGAPDLRRCRSGCPWARRRRGP